MLESLLSTMYHVFLPISFPVIGGMLLWRFRQLETKHLQTLYLYLLSPALIFSTLTKAVISLTDVTQTVAFAILNLLVLWAAANVLGRILRLNAADLAGLTLVSTFTNCVNYGLPLIILAFGQAGLDKASVYVIAQMVIVNSIGVYFAARSQFSVKDAFVSIFKLPAIYATIGAFLTRYLEIPLAPTIDTGITMLANAYAPVALVILGVQMVSAQRTPAQAKGIQKEVWGGLAMRLLLSPMLAYLVLALLQIEGTLFAVLLILASMPAAVNAVVLAERFDASPKLVSRCILWSTLASFVLLPVLLMWVT